MLLGSMGASGGAATVYLLLEVRATSMRARIVVSAG